MTPLDAYLALITPVAVLAALASGAAMGVVIRRLRPSVDTALTTYLALVLGACWYVSQWAPLFFIGGEGYGTLGRWTMYTLGFVPAMWLVLRWRRS